MRIAFLHMTMGVTNRGSEGVVDTIASQLAKKHEVLMIQSGKVTQKSYQVKRVYPLESAPVVAPRNILDKLLFRLHLDAESGAVTRFTNDAEPLLREYDPDIIIAINGPLQLRLIKGMKLRAKAVVFGHAGIGYHDRDTLRHAPDLFIALTPAAYDWALGLAAHKTKVVYIPNPLRVGKAQKIKLNLPSPVILTVAALSKYKNVDKVVSAASLLPGSLLLVGDGEERDLIESQLSTRADDFRWIRQVSPSDIASYYTSADVFCFVPDSQEAFGVVYLEAMAAGLPIVASDDRIRRELIGDKGIYVDPHDIESIRRGVVQAVRLGKLDYTKQLAPYELKVVGNQIEKELYELIA